MKKSTLRSPRTSRHANYYSTIPSINERLRRQSHKHPAAFAGKIKFAPHVKLSVHDEALVRNWPVLREQIERREELAFNLKSCVIVGAALVGKGKNRRPLLVPTRLTYTTPDGKESGYHVLISPDAASLLTVFRVYENDDTEKKNPEYYVRLIEEQRYAPAAYVLEVPCGFRDVMGSKTESAALAAIRESNEEAGYMDIKIEDLHDEGDVHIHPVNTEVQSQHSLVITMSRTQFENYKEQNKDQTGGMSHEQEFTRTLILPFDEARERVIKDGQSLYTLALLDRFAANPEHPIVYSGHELEKAITQVKELQSLLTQALDALRDHDGPTWEKLSSQHQKMGYQTNTP